MSAPASKALATLAASKRCELPTRSTLNPLSVSGVNNRLVGIGGACGQSVNLTLEDASVCIIQPACKTQSPFAHNVTAFALAGLRAPVVTCLS